MIHLNSNTGELSAAETLLVHLRSTVFVNDLETLGGSTSFQDMASGDFVVSVIVTGEKLLEIRRKSIDRI
jgi:hypothetical protein